MTQEQLQEELNRTQEQLKQALAEIARLKKVLSDDIDELKEKFDAYDAKRKKYEERIENQALDREERTSSQFGWGQAVNFVPVFSHAYSYGTSKANELVEREQKKIREDLSDAVEESYKEVEKLCDEIKKKVQK